MSNSNMSETTNAVKSATAKSEEQMKHPLQVYAETSGLPENKKETKPAKSSKKSAKKDSPSKPKRLISQEVVLQVIGSNKRIDIDELETKAQKISPRSVNGYKGLARLEFKIVKENDTEYVYPEISEHGLEVIAKYVGKRGVSHF